MGIRFSCPNGHKLHVKSYLAGKRAVCPSCGAKFVVPQAEDAQAVVRAAAEAGEPAPAGPASGAASPSIVISLVEPSRAPLPAVKANRPSANTPPVAASPAESASPIGASLPAAAGPTLVADEPADADDTFAVSPASKYAAHRVRSRRKQTALAIALLIAVVVLAIILIVVLQSQGTSAGQPDLVRIEISGSRVYSAGAALPAEHATKSRRAI